MQPVCPSPPLCYLFLIARIPSALLPAPPRIIYFTSQNCLFSFLTSSRVTCAPLSLALLNPSLHSLFSSLDSTFPQYSPPPPSPPPTNLVPLLPPLVSDSQSLPPATLCSPHCLHPAPGHLSLSCSGAVSIAHLPGYRLEGTEITVWLPGNPNLNAPHLVLEQVRDESALSQSLSKSQPPGLELQPAQPSPFPQPPATPLLPWGWGNGALLRAV